MVKKLVSRFGLSHLCELYGTTPEEFLETYALDCLVPCVCVLCGHTTELEPDQYEGWCVECESNSMKSGLVLMGVI